MNRIVVETYENYREEDRLSTNQARRIEFITTTRIMDELIQPESTILDCAAGTGLYAFYLADQGNSVTATDLTPRHVEYMRENLKNKTYQMDTAVLDAIDMKMFADESFDAVLNMGPFYHLISEEQRAKCLSESIRVLKKGGLLFTAYIPRYYMYQYMIMKDPEYLSKEYEEAFMQTGVISHKEKNCFWTDSYYSSKDEMENIYHKNGLQIEDHFAQDGLTPQFAKIADAWKEQQFKVWCEHHYKVCREQSILGLSNHVMIVGRK